MEELTIRELAGLSDMAYDKIRKKAAKQMGIRVTTLDKEVKKYKKSKFNYLKIFKEFIRTR